MSSLVDLMALEAVYRNDKASYDHVMTDLNFSRRPKKEQVTQAAQMNKDLQTSLLSMSNLLPSSAIENFSLLKAAEVLETDYAKLATDSKTVAEMYRTRYIAWTLAAIVLVYAAVRISKDNNNMS
jgi:hypothetical protein